MEHFTDVAAQILGIIFCLIILVRTEPAVNRMGCQSPPITVRLAFTLLACGAVAGIIAILAGKVPDSSSLILAAGTAALTICERRIRILTRIRSTRKGLNHAQR